MIHYFSPQRPHTSYIIYLPSHRYIELYLVLWICSFSLKALCSSFVLDDTCCLGIKKNRTECAMENQRLENLYSSIIQNILQCFPMILNKIVTTHCIADGRVEGPALIFSCENSKIATHCWTTVNRRMLDPTKERYPTSKGKGEAPARW